ncbi:molybdopterin-dependent oxidoreductase [Thiomonas sp.]|uniref:molybdopterin-dependent oxidoreductase n=1 Tax=Thiomonas sp. TaxID=2047785 RepID=UPI00262C17EA|nr:molybdopterin-dependent oxidoreductase [Thiomonas sp.]
MGTRNKTFESAARRDMLRASALGIGSVLAPSAFAAASIRLPLPGGPDERRLTTEFPGKGEMVLQRTRPPLLETPFSVYDKGVFTPVDQFYVRWHWAGVPTTVDAATHTVTVSGHVNNQVRFTLAELMHGFQHVELAAVNQCSGNSRGFFEPRVPGGEWGNGAMGNARWVGVRLRDVLDAAGVKPGAVQVQFEGADRPVVPTAPNLKKSLSVDHARDGEVMIAWQMNGQSLPLLNGFPFRLVVPGWYATYWTKALQHIRVLDHEDTNFWMHPAYTIPDNWPQANMTPGQKGVKFVPINRMVPRSFFTNLADAAKVPAGRALAVRGIAFGGAAGVRAVQLSGDGGRSWRPARLGHDYGRYSFRQWSTQLQLARGQHTLMVRCTNTDGLRQPMTPNWNPGGFMRNVVESVTVTAA